MHLYVHGTVSQNPGGVEGWVVVGEDLNIRAWGTTSAEEKNSAPRAVLRAAIAAATGARPGSTIHTSYRYLSELRFAGGANADLVSILLPVLKANNIRVVYEDSAAVRLARTVSLFHVREAAGGVK